MQQPLQLSRVESCPQNCPLLMLSPQYPSDRRLEVWNERSNLLIYSWVLQKVLALLWGFLRALRNEGDALHGAPNHKHAEQLFSGFHSRLRPRVPGAAARPRPMATWLRSCLDETMHRQDRQPRKDRVGRVYGNVHSIACSHSS